MSIVVDSSVEINKKVFIFPLFCGTPIVDILTKIGRLKYELDRLAGAAVLIIISVVSFRFSSQARWLRGFLGDRSMDLALLAAQPKHSTPYVCVYVVYGMYHHKRSSDILTVASERTNTGI